MAKNLPESIIIKEKTAISKMGVLSQQIFDAIRTNQLPDGFHNFIQFTVSELFMNIKEHSQSKKIEVDFVFGKNGKFNLSVRDFGIGIYNSYHQNGYYPKNTDSALMWALNGLSTKDFKERGFGLISISKLVAALTGKMAFTSDNSTLIMHNGSATTKYLCNKVKGCSVIISVKIKELDFYKIIS